MSLMDMSKSSGDRNDREVMGGTVAVRGRSLLIGNEIYQIPNISTVSVVDLSAERPIPPIIQIGACGGALVMFFAPSPLNIFAFFVAVGCGIAWIYQHVHRHVSRFALSILMNAGNRLVLVSNDQSFLKGMAIALNASISENRLTNLTFNLDQRQIFDNISHSAISTGSVSGDIVNNV